jgi:HK97 family phage major capsid protein
MNRQERIEELRKRAGELQESIDALRHSAEITDRDLSEEEEAKCSELVDELEEVTQKLTTEESREDRDNRYDVMKKEADKPKGPKTQQAGSIEVGEDLGVKHATYGFTSLADFAVAVQRADIGGPVDDRLQNSVKAATEMNTQIGSEGGFLVPTEYSNAIWNAWQKAAVNILGMTDSYTLNSGSWKVNAIDETSRATGSRYGGVRGYWVGEGDDITASKPSYKQITLQPHKLAVLVEVTEEQLADSPMALSQFLTQAAADEMNFLTGDAIINGSGTAKPEGIVGAACTVDASAETGQEAGTIVYENIINMWSRCMASWRNNAVWFINQDIEPQLFTMSLSVGTGGVPVYIPANGVSGAQYGTLMGRPVMPIEYAATLGTSGDIILANMKAYLSGTRGGINSAVSMHLKFDEDKSVFRWTYRVDGHPWMSSPITPFKGSSNTLSPFVTLATRS